MGYKVTAPLVLVRDQQGGVTYHYNEALLPSDVGGEQLQQLLDAGMVEKTGSDPRQTTDEQDAPPTVQVKKPAQVAPKEAWVEYAVSRGATPAEAELLTKQELIEQHGR